MSGLCRQSALAEPLAGTAPTETRWLFVEVPGSWGRDALTGCSLPPADRDRLASLPEGWRVVLARRPDRPLRRQRDRFVWSAGPGSPARWWRLPLAAPVLPQQPWTGSQEHGTVTEPLLFLCTNGGRDRCCALFGRGLFDELADPRVWECSHLSGHRFAPTAVRLPDLTVFGRLDPATAREALDGGPAAACLRGPAGWAAPVQAAAVAVWRVHRTSAVVGAHTGADWVHVDLADGSGWRVPVERIGVPARLLSCGKEPSADSAWRAGRPQPSPHAAVPDGPAH